MKIYVLGLALGLSLGGLMLAGCNEQAESNSAAGAAQTSAPAEAPSASTDTPAPVPTVDPAVSEVTAAVPPAEESAAARARREAKEAADEAAVAFQNAAGLSIDEARAVAEEKAREAREGLKDLGEKADQTLEKAGAEAGSALKSAAEKADSTIQRAAEKADGTLQRAAERADGKLSELASKASGALGLDEPSGPGSSVGLTESFLINQKFVLRKINEADFSGTSALPAPKLEFGEGFMVYGRVCNNFRGQGRLADGRLTVPAVASTRMACVDETFGQLENRLFTMLEKGAEITMNGAFLTLKEGETTLLFEADASI